MTIEAPLLTVVGGSTGAGKTTVTSLLLRFYDVQKGEVLINGHDVRTLDLRSLRKLFAIVQQDSFVLAASVADNIDIGRGLSRADIESAAKAVGLHAHVQRLPQGYDTVLDEKGQSLSVGQRQLLSFIRALLYNPSILILDEATSSIDTESEWLIEQAVQKLVAGRTSIVIAHRLSTIQRADQIIVLDKGEIIEVGNHQELTQKQGAYYNLVKNQLELGS